MLFYRSSLDRLILTVSLEPYLDPTGLKILRLAWNAFFRHWAVVLYSVLQALWHWCFTVFSLRCWLATECVLGPESLNYLWSVSVPVSQDSLCE